MKKILLTLCLIIALCGTSLHGFAYSSINDIQNSDSREPIDNYYYVETVEVYIQDFDNGEFKKFGIIDLFKNSEGYYFVKSSNGSGYIPVYNTIHMYSDQFKYTYTDYNKFFFNLSHEKSGYTFIRTVNVYVINYDDGGFKEAGIIDLYKDPEGMYYVKPRNEMDYIPVFNTIHMYRKDFKYSYMHSNEYFFN